MSGNLVIISSPSGGGKDTVIRALIKHFESAAKLVTTTTRIPRPEDEDGVTYYFTDKNTFENKLKNNELVEYNFYANNYYGTEKNELENKLENFNLVFSNIDVNGHRSLNKLGIRNLSIFLMPSNLDDLKQRIMKRGKVTEDDLKNRLETAKQEIESAKEYDFQVINQTGQLQETIDNVAKIITDYLQKTA